MESNRFEYHQSDQTAFSRWPGDMRWLLGRLRPYSRGYVALVLLTVTAGLFATVDPLIMRWVLDVVIPSHGTSLLPLASAMFLVSYSARVCSDQKSSLLSTRLTHVVIVALRLSILRYILKLPAEYHDNVAVGKTLFQLNDDARQVAETAVSVVAELTRVIVTTTAMLLTMLYVNARVTLVIAPLIVVYALLKRQWGQGVLRASELVEENSGKANALSQQIGCGIIPIQILRCETTILRRFVEKGRAVRDAVIARKLWDSRFTLMARASVVVGMAIVLGYGGYLVSNKSLTVGALVALYTYMIRICEPLAVVVDLDSRYEKGRTSLRHLHQIVSISEKMPNKSCGYPICSHTTPHKLVFDRVSFAYHGRATILHDVTFTVDPGEHLVFLGRTGSGKTTIIKLLLRLYRFYQGNIYLADREISQLDPQFVRTHFAVVPQEIFLFDGTVRENLLLANRYATPLELEVAIECSQLSGLLHRLPRGLDQSVGTHGAHLSGGERQRLALARALLQHSPILLLDEFTSALDKDTEYQILGQLQKTAKDRTVIAISHRPAVVSWADRVLALEGGSIVVDKQAFRSRVVNGKDYGVTAFSSGVLPHESE